MRNNRGLKVLGVALAVVLAAAATGCGRSDNNSSGGGGSGGSAGTAAGGGSSGGQVKPGQGFDGTTIKLGVITPTTGTAAVIGNPLTAGNKVYFDALNAKGGVAGKYKVELVVADSKYEPQTAVQQYATVKPNVVMFDQILGTAIVDAIKPQLATDAIMAGPASLDAFWVREPDLMPIGGPYQIQVINGIDYAVRKLDAKNKKLCALSKDDPYGETGIKGLEYAAQAYGLTITSQATFKAGDQDFTAQINQLQGAGCQLTLLVSLPNETGPILTAAAGRNFEPTWLGQSPTWVAAFAASGLAPYLEKNFLLLSEGPEWGDESVPGMKQMLTDTQTYAPDQKPDIYFAFGYAQSWAAAQILEQAVKNGDLSPQGVITASTQIKKLTFGQLLGDYTYGPPEDRDPPRSSTVFSVVPSAPGGLNALETNFSSEAAKTYEFTTS